jgi:ketosteroid isomerase-like protein
LIEDVVNRFWAAFERRDWAGARRLLADDAVLDWPVTGERIEGADGIIHVNAIYPEGWTIHPQRTVALTAEQVYSVVKVDHPPGAFYAVSFFRLHEGRIRAVEEYWSTVEEPPAWRGPDAIPGYRRHS